MSGVRMGSKGVKLGLVPVNKRNAGKSRNKNTKIPDPVILHLTLHKRHFLAILSGKKKEEYRDLSPYYKSRLYRFTKGYLATYSTLRHFDIVRFRNGYHRFSPVMDVKVKSIGYGKSKAKWCDGIEKYCFIIKL